MADEKQKPVEEIDLTAGDEAILDHVWDELDAKWRAEEQQRGDENEEHH